MTSRPGTRSTSIPPNYIVHRLLPAQKSWNVFLLPEKSPVEKIRIPVPFNAGKASTPTVLPSCLTQALLCHICGCISGCGLEGIFVCGLLAPALTAPARFAFHPQLTVFVTAFVNYV